MQVDSLLAEKQRRQGHRVPLLACVSVHSLAFHSLDLATPAMQTTYQPQDVSFPRFCSVRVGDPEKGTVLKALSLSLSSSCRFTMMIIPTQQPSFMSLSFGVALCALLLAEYLRILHVPGIAPLIQAYYTDFVDSRDNRCVHSRCFG